MTDVASSEPEALTDEAILVILPQRHREEVMVAFDRYLIMEDVEVTPMEGVAVYEGHGPNAKDLCDVARGAGAWAAPFDRTGRGGILVVAESGKGPAVDGALAKAVAECQGLVGPGEDWEALRLDVGLPAMDHDFGPSTYPQEAGLEKTAVSFSKGCYLGQEVVCMLEMRGQVKRRLVALELPGDKGLPPAGTSVDAADGQSVGEVSSAAHLPHRGTHRLLAMVKRQWADGTEDLLIQGHRASRIS